MAIAVRNELVSRLTEEPTPINDRMITLRQPLSDERYCTIIAIYAPTVTNSPEKIESFYQQLDLKIRTVPNCDKIILLGDFNARVGQEHTTWPKVLGRYGCGKLNSNGEILLAMCTEHQLAITNTFNHKSAHKHSWMHPRSKHWHHIDFIITRQRDLPDIKDTRAMRGANCTTDHIMIRTIANLKIRRKVKKARQAIRKLDISRIKITKVRKNLEKTLTEKLETLPSDPVEQKWQTFKEAVRKTSEEHMGYITKRHEDWFGDNCTELSELIESRNRARSNMLNRNTHSSKAKYKNCSKLLQHKCRALKNEWWLTKAAKLRILSDTNDNTTLLTENRDLLSRWTQHFRMLLNETPNIDPMVLESIIEHSPTQQWMDAVPEVDEIREAVEMLRDGKSPGSDGIHPEIIKNGGSKLLCALHEIVQEAWRTAEVPQDWKDGQLVTIFKKGDRQLCGNYRGISLLSIPGKVFARVLLNRLSAHAEQILSEAQCGFRRGRGTVDMIFSVKQIQEKCVEQNMPLYLILVDFTKAFDTVDRTALWKLLLKIGCPNHFTNLISALHTGMKASVNLKGQLSEHFEVRNGVKQGCVLAPTLFSIFLAAVLTHAFREFDRGVWIQSRPGADLFNVNQFKSKTKHGV